MRALISERYSAADDKIRASMCETEADDPADNSISRVTGGVCMQYACLHVCMWRKRRVGLILGRMKVGGANVMGFYGIDF